MLSIQDILRAQTVARWNIVGVTRPQSVAEHTFNVVFLSRRLARAINIPDERIIKYALEHDLNEIVLGDIPTPTKKRALARGWDLNDLFPGGKNKVDGVELQIVEIADVMDAVHYVSQYGVGRHAAVVKERLMKTLTKRIGESIPHLRTVAWSVFRELTCGEYTI